jgi:hypothetical protein
MRRTFRRLEIHKIELVRLVRVLAVTQTLRRKFLNVCSDMIWVDQEHSVVSGTVLVFRLRLREVPSSIENGIRERGDRGVTTPSYRTVIYLKDVPFSTLKKPFEGICISVLSVFAAARVSS